MTSAEVHALLVPYRDAQRALEAASGLGILDSGLRIQRTERGLLLPVVRVPARLADRAGPIEFTATGARFEPTAAKGSYREFLPWPESERALLPGAFDVVGDIALVRFPDELRARWPEAGAALMRQHKSIQVVLQDHGVEGDLRVRAVEHVAGEPRTVTEHREHGMRLRVDVATVYFSPRLATERKRIASLVRPGERVLDMFAGCGPFSILIARRLLELERETGRLGLPGIARQELARETGRLGLPGNAREARPGRVVAIDANPEAHRYLVENVRRNKVQAVVEPALGLAQDLAPSFAPVDRVVMNLPRLAPSFLPLAVQVMAARGTLHLYEVVPEDQVAARAELRRFEAASYPGVASCALLGARDVRTYAPRQVVVAVDLRVEKA